MRHSLRYIIKYKLKQIVKDVLVIVFLSAIVIMLAASLWSIRDNPDLMYIAIAVMAAYHG